MINRVKKIMSLFDIRPKIYGAWQLEDIANLTNAPEYPVELKIENIQFRRQRPKKEKPKTEQK